MAAGTDRIKQLLEPTISALGLELWGVEHLGSGRGSVLRIYIDSHAGVDIDDCERASRQISALLDVEDPIAGEYTLEVSSPGLERPLFTREHYERYLGSEARLKLREPYQGRRRFKGVIERVEDDQVEILVDGQRYVLPLALVDKAALTY